MLRMYICFTTNLCNTKHSPQNTTQIHFKTPLHYAARHGFYDIAFLLLRAGAYVDALGKDNRTPLHVACRDGGSSVLALLIRNGADMYVVLSILA